MALVAHQTNGHSTLTVRAQPWSRVVKLRCFVDFQLVGRTDRLASLKHRLQFSGQHIILPKEKPLKVSSFKGNCQNDGADDTDRDYKFSKKTVNLSTARHKSEETATASPDVPSDSLSYAAGNTDDAVAGSQSIDRLFKRWLKMLQTQTSNEVHTQTSNEAIDEIYSKSPVESRTPEIQEGILRGRIANVLKVAFLWFMGLDATIKFPLLIFVPWYLITRVLYGIEVTEELTPLWVLGPLITAFYIKTFQGICFLYVFCFKQVIKFVENVPTYYMLIYSYVVEGKLNAFLYAHFCQPIVDVKNMDYRALVRERLKQLKEWAVEKYLDYVESIWPYYCRTIRFLKKANLL
uniref:50S ribosomal protein L23 n=1 Tax=Anthurium amnicola TaxID=1678845 RepID=A0A1D1Y4W0_9ARAE